MMDFTFEDFSDIVQIPCIVVKGEIQQPLSDYSKLDLPTLRTVAAALGGDIIYLKARATVSQCEVNLCTYGGCYRPVVKDTRRCGDHVL